MKTFNILPIHSKQQLLFYALLMVMSYINLEYMHYTILTDRTGLGFFPYIENICFTFIDVCLLYSLPILLIKKKSYLLFIPYIFLTIFILANIWYSRYFYNYLPPSLYREFNNLDGLSNNIFSAIHISDLFIVITTGTLLYFYIRYYKSFGGINKIFRIKLYVALIGTVGIIISTMMLVSTRNWPTLESKFIAPYSYATTDCNFKFGIIHSTLVQLYTEKNKTKYSNEELKKLQPYFKGITNHVGEYKQNLILIIVESLLSYATEQTINGQEITPNLNQLVKEGAYYNCNMTSLIQLGESSDGQFIYLTGLLPQSQGVTIIDYFNNTFQALPFYLKKKHPSLRSQMTIPTSSKMWRQDAMCAKYDIDYLYSRKEYPNKDYANKWLDDKTLFEYAAHCDKPATEPFFSVILTSSTHTPYKQEHEPSKIQFPANYSTELKTYLSNVHYMDKYLGKYIQKLKEKGLYNNSLIVVTSDHAISEEWLNPQSITVTKTLPLYLINSPVKIDKGKDYPITQADVFPTLMDLMGINSKWRGVGSSLLTPDSISKQEKEIERQKLQKEIAEIILESNFFSKTNSKF